MGYEHDGIQGAPGFRRLGEDDFRLTPGPASTHGVPLQDPLADRDPWDVPDSPSIGAFRADERRLEVGVDGRHVVPPIG